MIVDRDELRQAVSDAEMKSAADAMAKVKVILQKVRRSPSDPVSLSRRFGLPVPIDLSRSVIRCPWDRTSLADQSRCAGVRVAR